MSSSSVSPRLHSASVAHPQPRRAGARPALCSAESPGPECNRHRPECVRLDSPGSAPRGGGTCPGPHSPPDCLESQPEVELKSGFSLPLLCAEACCPFLDSPPSRLPPPGRPGQGALLAPPQMFRPLLPSARTCLPSPGRPEVRIHGLWASSGLRHVLGDLMPRVCTYL